jgi:hypothetical protein
MAETPKELPKREKGKNGKIEGAKPGPQQR